MEQKIKAIETRYKGYKFRSRTEARWAVFFDAFGVNHWEYEKEGFELPSGRYLPDFWVEWGWKGWIEVKGEKPDETSKECRLCQELSHLSGQEVLLVSGVPSWEAIYRFLPDGFHFGDVGEIFGYDERVQEAIDTAKAARFEHGESP